MSKTITRKISTKLKFTIYFRTNYSSTAEIQHRKSFILLKNVHFIVDADILLRKGERIENKLYQANR